MSDKPESPSPSHENRRRRETARNTRGRVVTYLAILFAAAFFLLLMSYFMQQRANREAIDGLTQTVNSIHSLQNLIDVNKALEEENAALKTQNETLEKQKEALFHDKQALTAEANALKDQAAAMQYFWQIDEAYVRGRYKLCRSLMEDMQAQATNSGGDTKLVDFLSTENSTGNDRFSPYDRYMEIYNALY